MMSDQQQRRAAKQRRRHIRKTKIVTEGRKVAGVPFQGETMICVMCGKTQQSDPAVESQWRCLEVDGNKHYVCPAHFPPDDTGTVEEFRQAYIAVIKRIYAIQAGTSD